MQRKRIISMEYFHSCGNKSRLIDNFANNRTVLYLRKEYARVRILSYNASQSQGYVCDRFAISVN